MTLHRVVDAYQGKTDIYHVAHPNMGKLNMQYPSMSCVVTFPHLQSFGDIRYRLSGLDLPTGITRHFIPLHPTDLDIPLDFSIKSQTHEEQNEQFNGHIALDSHQEQSLSTWID